jgi:hypothetical protein
MQKSRALSIGLICLGSFLEVYYSAYRYIQDGIPVWLGIIIGLALNVFLMICMIQKRHVLALCLIVFSIISTSAGQTFSLIQKQSSEIVAAALPEVEELRKESEELGNEKSKIEAQIEETVKTLQDRYQWRNTLAAAEDRKREIERLILSNRERIDSLSDVQKTKIKENNIYTFYEGLTRDIFKADALKFILHTILSVFIALMAPAGILALGSEERKEKPKEKKKPLVGGKYIDGKKWLALMWSGEKKGKMFAPSEALLEQWAAANGYAWDSGRHARRLAAAINGGALSQAGGLLVTYEKALSMRLGG